MEAMRFNDRQELLDKIKLWKKNYERVCCERDEVEDHYKDLVERKESQLQNMLVENDEEREATRKAKEEGEDRVKQCEAKWKLVVAQLVNEKEELEAKLVNQSQELDKAKFQQERALLINAKPAEDPMVTVLKEKVKEMEEQIVAVEAGKQAIIDENASLSVKTENVADQMEDVHAIYKPIIDAKDKEIKKMEEHHEELKEVLKLEMKRAQDTCLGVEEQVKRFPDPFIDEIQEMKDKYAQMQAGMAKIQVENLKIKEENEKERKAFEKEIKDLEKSLSMAKSLLHEVSTLEALKHLHTSEARRAEEDLGLSLSG